jgi:hypothetical protein
MSYTYSLALAVAFSEGNCLDTEQSAQLKSSLIPEVFLLHDKMMGLSHRSRFGMTCKPLTDDLGAALLTWFVEAFHARTSAQQEKAQDLTEHEADYGGNLRGLLAKYDQDTHSLRTAQCSFLEDLTGYSLTLPRWGTMRNGAVYQQPIVELGMRETEFGFSPDGLRTFHTPSTGGLDGGSNSRRSLKKKWPTPCARDCKGARDNSRPRDSLDYAVERGQTKSKTFDPPPPTGQLNPTWVEWLMGWPSEHTALKPLATDKCPYALLSHLNYWRRVLNDIKL